MNGDEDKRAFLAEYRELCLKHGMQIDSCGCCNGPWLVEATDRQIQLLVDALMPKGDGCLGR